MVFISTGHRDTETLVTPTRFVVTKTRFRAFVSQRLDLLLISVPL